ncbi:iron complex outermembrane receptor protein [Pseudomonas sp. SJZ079]|uniref:TonB-dependent siderophore receptor n=1 Tax=Pseudomonas sp. SJZ079 TaxID=2572887 RepID=UPI00119908E5|nr:TonB-dependent siderophore receptor [Pseudomonas sp. SJZ079]TWC37063.1 iron complex outermembrane receptor protein [Pseudomonas sp. SJZ079]
MPSSRSTHASLRGKSTLIAFALLPTGQALAEQARTELQLPSQEVIAPRAAEEGYRAQTGSTASKSDIPLKEEAQSVQVVTPQTIEDYQVKSLDDAMKFVSGMTQSNTLAGTQDGFVKRGFGTNTDGSILRDGVRTNLSRNFDATSERVEVLKGPASLLYGALEPGGLINVISKKPHYLAHTRIAGEYASVGGGNLSIDTTGPLGDSGFAYRLITERQHEDYWRNYGSDAHSLLAPSLSWSGDDLRIDLAYQYKEFSTPVDRGTVLLNNRIADSQYNRQFGETWAKSAGIDQIFNARLEYRLNPQWTTRLSYSWNQEKFDFAEAIPTAGQPNLSNNGNLRRRANGAAYDNDVRYLAWDWIGNSDLFGQEHDLLLGVDNERVDNFRGETYRGTLNNDSLNIYNPVYGSLAEPKQLSTTQSDRNDEVHSTSLYAKDNWHLNEQWILVLGGRYQHYEQFLDQGRGSDYSRVLDDNGEKFLLFAGLVYALNDQVSLYANYSESFKPNQSDSLANAAAFKPEEGVSREIGAKIDLTPNLSSNIAFFAIEKENVVVTLNGEDQAAGKVGSRGVEIDLNGRIAERWNMIATYAYTDTEILDDPDNQGNSLVNAAKHMGSLYLTHDLALPTQYGAWRAGAGARHVGKRAVDNSNAAWLDSYTLADAFVSWETTQLLGEKTKLQLNANNLFNKEYYPSSGGSLRIAVGEPRELRLSASVDF